MSEDRDEWRDQLEGSTRSADGIRSRLEEALVPGLTVLCHPDLQRVGERAALTGLLSGKPELLSRLEPKFAPPDGGVPRPLADDRLSRRPLHLVRTSDGCVVLDATDSPTAVVAEGAPLEGVRKFTRDEIRRGVVLLLASRVALVLHTMEPLVLPSLSFGLVGESAAIGRVRQEIRRVADLPFPVLLRGESGTGKELVARAIHDAGPRRDRPYLGVNLGAVPPSLAAAELFGAAKGAFTGADRPRPGYFQQASGGTLFLDEIGEAPPEIQVHLLRALDTRQIQPVGAQEPRTVDVRVISATDVDLEAAVAAGEFRSPLLHRLSSYEIILPPLRELREDFGRLFCHFLRQEMAAVGDAERLRDPGPEGSPWVPAELVARLAACQWPGNVRQLRNVVRQLAVASRGCSEMQVPARVEDLLKRATPRPEGPGTDAGEAEGGEEGPLPGTEDDTVPPAPYRSPREVSEAELLEC